MTNKPGKNAKKDMTERKRYLETLLFGNPDKIPLQPGSPRESTLAEWARQGLPEGTNYYDVKEIKASGCPIIDVDCDGYIGELIPLWIESGINVCDPVEVAAYNDIVEYRRLYGKSMAYTGGIDKRAIAKGGKDMVDEVMRVVPPLLKDGGFIPGCDHGVPSDISWPNYVEYARLLSKLTGWL
ncbi:MAG: hypothetical protein GX754_06135 [Clostridiaceae bacterium]|nr:hypothetical protein [Clostridiaceae bacterium]